MAGPKPPPVREPSPVAPSARDTRHRQPPGAIGTILTSLRRAPRQIRRGSRDVIQTAVSQLFDAVVAPHAAPGSAAQYRIEELARLADTTPRNIRVYRDRGLLHPPLRVGRLALFDDTHVTRLRLITSMLDRGYTIAHVKEMLAAWEQGKDVGDMLGLESALVGSWATERPERMTEARARDLVGGAGPYDRMTALGIIRRAEAAPPRDAAVPDAADPDTVTVVRPRLIEAFNEIRRYGISADTLIDLHEYIAPLIDQISGALVTAGVEHVAPRLAPGAALPPDTEVAELITMLVRFRTQAIAAVSATLAFSIESTIELVVGQILSEVIDQAPDETG